MFSLLLVVCLKNKKVINKYKIETENIIIQLDIIEYEFCYFIDLQNHCLKILILN